MVVERSQRASFGGLLQISGPLKIKIGLVIRVSFYLGPVVQSVVSLTSSLRVISLTVLADSI